MDIAQEKVQLPSNRTTRFALLLGLVALCALLVANAAVQRHAAEQILEASHWVEHTLAVDAQLQTVGSLLRDAETGQRGYLLTGDATYLQPYEIAARDLPIEIEKLSNLVKDNPGRGQAIARLQDLTASKMAELRNTVELYKQGHADAARTIVQTNVGKNQMDQIRATLAEMEQNERVLLSDRESSLRSIVVRQRVALLLALTIGLLGLVAFGWAMNHLQKVRDFATAAVRESEEWLDTTVTSIGDAVIATNAHGHVRFLNRVAQELTQCTQEQAAGRPLAEVFPIFNEETREVVENPVQKAIATGKVVGLANHTILRRPDGSEIAIDDSAAPIMSRAGEITGVVLVFRDVTEHRKVEEAMRISEKLAATGKMAATVAHEINNPLEAASNLLFLLQDESGLSAEGRTYLRMAEQQLSRVTQITKQTLAFYRDPRGPEPLLLGETCDRIVELYRPRFHNKAVKLDVEYEQELVVLGTEGEIAQVVSNLLSNAVDASNENGTVRFRVGRGDDHQGVIQIVDSGSGIRKADLPKIFEPFFTTKKHVGTGLGLWVSREIVHKLGGTIEARSDGENRGSSFTVTLPLYNGNGEAQ